MAEVLGFGSTVADPEYPQRTASGYKGIFRLGIPEGHKMVVPGESAGELDQLFLGVDSGQRVGQMD